MTNRDRNTAYKNAVLYRIYPKSFYDSDGDGVGDLKGIIAKLPYILSLGVDALVLVDPYEGDRKNARFFPTDLRRVDPAIGSSEDFSALTEEAHRAGLSILVSLSLLCTSLSHPWFVKSASKADNGFYKEYYIWREGKDKKGKKPPDASKNLSGSPLWQYDRLADKWYQTAYGVDSPLLNYDNPRVRKEIATALRYWKDLGADGFMIDDASFAIKKPLLADLKQMYKATDDLFTFGGPLFHLLTDLYKSEDEEFPMILNAFDVPSEVYPYLLSPEKPAADYISAECLLASTRTAEGKDSFSSLRFVRDFLSIQSFSSEISLAFSLEDDRHQRFISNLVKRKDKRELPAVKLAATLLLTAAGTPVIYQGEEIGMTNYRNRTVESRYSDTGAELHALSPYHWDNKPNAAFTEAAFPYLPVNENYHEINVVTELSDPQSALSYYRSMIAFRKASSALSHGSFKMHSDNRVIAYVRESEDEKMLIVANITEKPINYKVPSVLLDDAAVCVVCNYPIVGKPLYASMGLRPYEIRIFRLRATLKALN